jgi:arginyl-tRNA synthetase
MSLVTTLKEFTAAAINQLYAMDVSSEAVLVNETKPEFEGDYTIVLFSLVKQLKKAPDVLGDEMGGYLQAQHPELITGFNVIKGFLNLTVADAFFTSFLLHGLRSRPGACYAGAAKDHCRIRFTQHQ